MHDLSDRCGCLVDAHAVACAALDDLAAAQIDRHMAVAAGGSLAGADDITGGSFAHIRSDIDGTGIGTGFVAPLIGVDELFADKSELAKDMVDEP